MEEGAMSQGMQADLETEKAEDNSALEPPEGTQSLGHFDSSPVRLIVDL